MKKVHLVISGTVQGVSFRAWATMVATTLNIVGWVRNRDDGTVEIVAQGEKSNVVEFITLCHRGPREANVANVEQQWENATSEFTSFDVVY